MGPKIVGKLEKNMVLGSFIFGCIIRPGPTGICKVQYFSYMSYKSLGINLNQLLGFLPPTKEVPHTCKIVYYF